MTTEPSLTRHATTHTVASASSRPFAKLILPAGLALVAAAWTLAWAGPEPIRWYTFFPLWLGYVLTVNGLNHLRTGFSFLTDAPRQFAALFAISVPLWWVFEALNTRLKNWEYHLPLDYPPVIYTLLASLAFSTVAPAMLGTASLYRSLDFPWIHRRSPRRELDKSVLVGMVWTGAVMLLLVVLIPRQAFPLAWLSLFFLIDPVNGLAGRPSLFVQAAEGRWSTIISLCCAAITCGFFWEMWNINSMPKWTYDVPYVGFLKIFEMPILGYGGYLPFACEIFALVSLTSRWFPSLHRVLLEDAKDLRGKRDR